MDAGEIFAFVLMPFDPHFDDVYKIGIKEAAQRLGIVAQRVDEQIYAEGILERIYRQIEAADIIIADMSEQNPNVFYEVGYAHAKNKLCILLTSSGEDIPFDLKHRRHIVYGDSVHTLREDLVRELEWAKTEVENVRRSRIRVEVKEVTGDLEKTSWSAYAKVDVTIHMHNDSDVPSPSIDAVYFYTGNSWKVHQDGTECSSADSDMEGFKFMHFLRPPIGRLRPKSWAPLRFTTRRIVAFKRAGDELKGSYPIKGTAAIRLVTDAGNFDYEFLIDAVASTLPF